MADLQRAYTPDNPLMQPVQYDGQEYFTSQYFWQQYLENSPYGGKYRQHSDFLRVIRGIETYLEYLARADIVELAWHQVKSSSKHDLLSALTPAFEARGYQKLYLLNATAQVALSHHLDDEISKQMSVATNTTVARQATRKPLEAHTPLELATRDMSAWLDAGKLFGAPLHIVQQEGVKLIATTHGVDFRPLLLAAPAQDNIRDEERMLEPTDLANEFGWGSSKRDGMAMNNRLEALGWQVKKIGGGWEATPLGKPHSAPHAWTEHGKTGYNLKWRVAAVRQALGMPR